MRHKTFGLLVAYKDDKGSLLNWKGHYQRSVFYEYLYMNIFIKAHIQKEMGSSFVKTGYIDSLGPSFLLIWASYIFSNELLGPPITLELGRGFFILLY